VSPRVGLIGAGNMAAALARGWGDPVLATDTGSGRAQALVAELGGEVAPGNGALAEAADIVVLACKPAQLAEVAEQVGGRAKAVVSLLARTPIAQLREAFPGTPVARVEPNTPVSLRRGVSLLATESDDAVGARELFERVGTVIEIGEKVFNAAAGVSAVGPAYWALLVEAQVDAAVKRGLTAAQASVMVTETMAGSAELLREYGHDTLGLRRAVASPGGTTAKGLAALERGGVRAAFLAAMDDVAGPE
jgi:pyrroline-5-carboxylate reductase